MARRRVPGSPASRLLIFCTQFAAAGARPLLDILRRCSLNACPTTTTSEDDNNSDHGGFTTASIVGLAVGSASAIFFLMWLYYYFVYYKHEKLKLRREYLQRLGSLEETITQQGQAVAEPSAASEGSSAGTTRPRPRVVTDLPVQNYGLATLMSSSAQLSPAVFSALQRVTPGEAKSPTLTEDFKTKAAMPEDKVLGHCKDIRHSGHGSDVSATDP
ncbi:hypothetical protein M406DRAFT_69368 [Cryphonectria parasitica EP155]|uniref:Membrane-associated protein n=1 Tax=Cryphonectria parasitica (strain ATCC 38755 / EP155) TaxID=660469 RepID=A0A9P4Y6W1_CRYP1|nr:uncharacterized protein M406DRAFT_69368 [Cryphonectria parasitica EP155]KAF3767205.1 hypothetical protein M406DRAFT_69368 [Cryphonectria parasitica EP155]